MPADRNSRDGGFTLIELLIAVVVSGIIISALAAGVLVAFRGTADANERFIESHGAQTLATYFTSDVQSANPTLVDTSSTQVTGCSTSSPLPAQSTNVVRLQWTENTNSTTKTAFSADYRMEQVPATAEWQLVRYFCTNAGAPTDSVDTILATAPPTTHLVAHQLPATGQQYSDGVTTAGSKTITSATAAFTASDVSLPVTGANIPGGASIASVTNATTAVLSIPATGSATGVTVSVGRAVRTVTDAVTSNGSTTLTSSSGAFSAGDVGRVLTGANIPGGTTIMSVTNSTTVVMSSAASGSGSALTARIGAPAALVSGSRVSLSLSAIKAASESAPYAYTLTAVMRTPNPSAPSPAFLLSIPTSSGAGNAVPVTVTATTDGTTPDPTYAGSHSLTFTGAHAAPSGQSPVYPTTPVTFNASGSWTGTITLYDAETTALAVTDGDIIGTSSSNITVAPGSATQLLLTTPSGATAGTPFSESITAKDAYLNTAALSGSKTITWTGPHTAPDGTHAPTPSTTVPFSSGVASASLTLYDAEATTLTANLSSPALTGTSASFTVSPGPVGRFLLGAPGTQTAGVAFNESIAAQDAYQNPVTTLSGSQPVVWSGPHNAPNAQAPAYPPSVTFSNGSGTASITLYDAEATAMSATLGSANGTSAGFTVNGGGLSKFGLSTPAPSVGGAFTETVTGQDAWGNTATSITGNQTVTWSGPHSSPNNTSPLMPTTLTFSNGVATPSLTLFKVETSITLTVSQGTATGVSGAFNVAGPTVTATATDGKNSGNNQTNDVISGTTTPNSNVVVSEQSPHSGTAYVYSGTANATGAFSINVENIKGNGQGTAVSYLVTVTDPWGNQVTTTVSYSDGQ